MPISLIETLQNNLHYPPLKKIDPNTQEVKADTGEPGEHLFSQAAIPAVLTGLYTYSGKDEGADHILRGEISSGWVNEIFGNQTGEVVQKVATYANRSYEETLVEMDKIAAEAVAVIKTNIKADGTIMDVKNLLSTEIKDILKYLPEALHMGQAVHEESLDDNTHKMEGPISSLMHKIGSAFSNPSNESEVNTKG